MSQIKVILLASLLLLPLPALAQTQVPHTFTDGTPALASEVNENFDALADGVNAQDVRIEELEDEGEGEGKEPVHTFTYTKNDQEAGYEFQLGGVDYRLVDFPVYEYSAGDRYVVRLPIHAGTTGLTLKASHLFESQLAVNIGANKFDIDGYEGATLFREERTYSVNSYNGTVFEEYGYCFYPQLIILETVVALSQTGGIGGPYLYYNSTSEDISPQDTSANSYVDSFPAPSERDPDLARTACDDLIDYIQIFGPSQTRDTPP